MTTEKRLLIDATHTEETRVIIADEYRIHEFDISATSKTQNKGNIYLAKVTRVEPSLQAAFVEYGGGRQGFLPFSEIHPDYYQIPVDDRKKLMEEVAAEQEAEEAEEEQEQEAPRRERSDRDRDRGRGRRGRRRFGGRDRNRGEQDAAQTDGEQAEPQAEEFAEMAESRNFENTDAEVTGTAPESASSNTYLQEPIAASPVAKSEIVEELDEAPQEREARSEKKRSREADEEENDEVTETGAGEEKSGIESLGDEDEFTRRRKASFLRRYKIQEVIKRNQVMLVQVIKEERGNKGASLSTYISLAGRYCVLMPNSPKTGGISRKISSSEDRKRLKAISEEIRSDNGMSAIIRTAGIDRTRAEIKRDYDYLIKLWSQIRETTLASTAPALVYEEADIVKRSLRDLYSSDIKEVVVSGEEAYKRAREFMKLMMPSHTARIKLHTDPTPIFYAYDAEEQLLRMHEPQVKLESGGSIVLNPTEALVSIDVNSGRSTTERNVEETALKTNLEAAQEIARQVRLRDLAGLIVIDFIDMFEYKNRRAVERQLKEALKNDRAKIQLGRISAFGLLEMSRQRLRPSLAETNTHTCSHCSGRGFVLTPDAQGIQLLRFVEKEASSQEYASFKLKVPTEVAIYLLNTKRERLIELEKAHNIHVTIEIGEGMLSASSFILERYTAEGQKTEINGMEGIPTSGKRKRDRKRKRNDRDRSRPGEERSTSQQDAAEEELVEHIESGEEAETQEARKEPSADGERPSRRRRGGRRRGGRDRDRDRSREDRHQPQQPEQGEAFEREAEPAAAAEAPAPVAEAPRAEAETVTTAAEEKPAPRKRVGRPRKAATKVTEADGEPAAKPAAAAKTAPAPSKTRELEPVGAEAHTGEDSKKTARKGWWRRMVE